MSKTAYKIIVLALLVLNGLQFFAIKDYESLTSQLLKVYRPCLKNR